MSESSAVESGPVEADWERKRREHNGYMDPVRDDNVRDPAYITARIQGVLDSAREMAAKVRANVADMPGVKGDQVERDIIADHLPRELQRLLDELRPHSREGDAFIKRLAEAYPELQWMRVGPTFLGVRDFFTDPATSASVMCADALGLAEEERTVAGDRQWRGDVDGWRVSVIGSGEAVES